MANFRKMHRAILGLFHEAGERIDRETDRHCAANWTNFCCELPEKADKYMLSDLDSNRQSVAVCSSRDQAHTLTRKPSLLHPQS